MAGAMARWAAGSVKVTAIVLFGASALGACKTIDRQPGSLASDDLRLERLLALDRSAAPFGEPDGQTASDLAYVGREDLGVRRTGPACEPDSHIDDIWGEIARRARSSRLVIINEAHHAPLHRAFILQGLKRLKAEGFRVYAAETFAPQVGSKPWVSTGDGWYSNEPVYGEVVRQARDMGYRLVPYEDFGPRPAADVDPIAHREAVQARSLHRQLSDEMGGALIHVGYMHASERPQTMEMAGHTNLWMAYRLKESLKRDPVTIDITEFIAMGEAPYVCQVTTGADAPAIKTDLYVALPAPRFQDGRPTWRRSMLGQTAIYLPGKAYSETSKVIFEARRHQDPQDAVPVDRLMTFPGERLPMMLNPGRYRVTRWHPDDGLSEFELDVGSGDP